MEDEIAVRSFELESTYRRSGQSIRVEDDERECAFVLGQCVSENQYTREVRRPRDQGAVCIVLA